MKAREGQRSGLEKYFMDFFTLVALEGYETALT